MSIAAAVPLSCRSFGTVFDLKLTPCRSRSVAIFNLTTKPRCKPVSTSSNFCAHADEGRRNQSALFCLGSGGIGGGGGKNYGGSGGGGNDEGRGDEAADRNKTDALLALAEIGRSLDTIPKDLASAIESGRIPGSVVFRYCELEKAPLFRWLLQFGGFKERLLADDLFLAKVAMECGVGVFTKTAAEYERRREKFFKELEIVFADVTRRGGKAPHAIPTYMMVQYPWNFISKSLIKDPMTTS